MTSIGIDEETEYSAEQQAMIRRLRRLEGQIRGIERMVIEGKSCEEVLMQIAAAKSAIDKVATNMVTHRMEECLAERMDQDPRTGVSEAMKMFHNFMKHYG